jgi:hypothetical protein
MKPSVTETRAIQSAQETHVPAAQSSGSNAMSRRVVFAGAGAVGALAAVAAVLPDAPSGAVAADSRSRPDDGQGRYQATAHVKRYYQTARV